MQPLDKNQTSSDSNSSLPGIGSSEEKVATLKLIPRFNWILLERPEVKDQTDSGLFLPSSTVEQKQKFANYGTILEMGEDVNTDRFQVGMLVVFAASGGYTVKVQGEVYFFVLESDIIASDIGPEPKRNPEDAIQTCGTCGSGVDKHGCTNPKCERFFA